MVRLWFILGLVVVILTVYALVDCALFDRNRIRGLPRWAWIFVVLLVPVVGPLLWLFVGRGRSGSDSGRGPRSMAPDDDPDFLKGLNRARDQEERIRQLEKELADLDKPDPRDPKKSEPGEGDLPGRRDA
jgi:hypothetical protein